MRELGGRTQSTPTTDRASCIIRIMANSHHQDLLNYRRIVSENYARLRGSELGLQARWGSWCKERDELFGGHSQSALDERQRAEFAGLNYYDYDEKWRYLVEVDRDVDHEVIEVPLQDDGIFKMQRFGRVRFAVGGEDVSLYLYWVMGYGGGVFLPFRDATNETGETYGGGRYLLDSIKGADLGGEDGKLVLDFNYAYNASCAYNPRWHCPLAPQENWLEVAIPAGEQTYGI